MVIHVGRFLNRETAHFTVEVLTPMFLGGANGNAELRSPPVKNALRYWWRLTQGDLPTEKLLETEQALFGGVNEDRDMQSNRSCVDVVVKGDVRNETDKNINFGKKKNAEAGGKPVSLAAYLGMGPIHFHGTYEKFPIAPGESFKLFLNWPQAKHDEMLDTISLFSHFGCLGARSRNGWGSIKLSPVSSESEESLTLRSLKVLYEKYGENVAEIFKGDKKYPFKLGTKNRDRSLSPLFWKISDGEKWNDVMKAAGEHYMDLRQILEFPKAKPQGVQKRHIMGYPVTGHSIGEWGGFNGRMPSQLRIIVRKTHDGRYASYFFHLPHPIPKPWNSNLGTEISVWQDIHTWLDNNCRRISFG